jgi:hypothetical protein
MLFLFTNFCGLDATLGVIMLMTFAAASSDIFDATLKRFEFCIAAATRSIPRANRRGYASAGICGTHVSPAGQAQEPAVIAVVTGVEASKVTTAPTTVEIKRSSP